MQLSIETEQESDDRWIAEVPLLPGVLAYMGKSRRSAVQGTSARTARAGR
jgi:predicted RNase H-like HicB family nuclease